MSSLCAIAFPQIEDQLRRTLADLSGHGMLDPIALVTDKETTLLDAGELTPIDLDQFLATQKLDELVLIAISLADGDALRLPLDIGDQAARLRQRCAAAGIDFRATSLVVPAETTPIPATALHADWEANVILVPEDSAGSRGMTATALSPSDVPFVASSAAATLGGAWSWMTAPPMATETIRYVQGERSAYLARLTLRLVDGGDIAAKLVGWALDPSGSWPVPDGCTVHPNAPGAVADLAEAISAAPEVRFSYRPLPEEPTVPRRRIGLLAALRLFFSRLWVHLRKLPALSMRQARASASEAVHQFAQAQTFGESELVIGPRSGPSDVGSIADSRTRIARLSALPHLRVDAPIPTPETWQTIRSVAFGVIDGSDFIGSLAGSELQFGGTRAVIGDRSAVGPDFGDASTGGFSLSLAEAAALAKRLEGKSASNGFNIGAADATGARLLEQALRSASAEVAPIVKTEGDEGASNHDAPDDETNTEIAQITRTLARFEAWRSERSGSLLWKLGEHLDQATSEAFDALAETEAELQATVNELESADQTQRKLLTRARRWSVLLLVLLLMAIVGAGAALIEGNLQAGLSWLGVLAVVLAFTSVAYLSTARAEVRLEYRLREIEHRPERLRRERNHAANEVARLTVLNEQLREWADIVVKVIHRPWGTEPDTPRDTPWEAPSETLSFVCARPELNPDVVAGEVIRLRREICRPRWLSAVYLELQKEWAHRYQQLAGWSTNHDLAADSDTSTARAPIASLPTGDTVYAPRLQFASEVVSGRHAIVLRRTQVNSLRDQLESDEVSQVLTTVRSDIPGLDMTEANEFLGSLVEFSPPSFSSYVTTQLPPIDPSVKRCVFGLTEAIEAEVPADSIERQRVPVQSLRTRLVLAAFRLDLSDLLEIDSIALVDPVAPQAPQATTETSQELRKDFLG